MRATGRTIVPDPDSWDGEEPGDYPVETLTGTLERKLIEAPWGTFEAAFIDGRSVEVGSITVTGETTVDKTGVAFEQQRDWHGRFGPSSMRSPDERGGGAASSSQYTDVDRSDAIRDWTGSSLQIMLESSDLMSGSKTAEGARPGSSARNAAVLLDEFNRNAEPTPELYRGFPLRSDGIFTSEQNAALLRDIQNVGGVLDLPLVPSSESRTIAEEHSRARPGTNDIPIVFTVAAGADGINLQGRGGLENEREWITAGRFTVMAHEVSSDGTHHVQLQAQE